MAYDESPWENKLTTLTRRAMVTGEAARWYGGEYINGFLMKHLPETAGDGTVLYFIRFEGIGYRVTLPTKFKAQLFARDIFGFELDELSFESGPYSRSGEGFTFRLPTGIKRITRAGFLTAVVINSTVEPNWER